MSSLAAFVTRLAQYAVVVTTIFFVLVGTSSAATYYVDFANGSDANPGTKTQPWKRSPGMSGFAGNYAHSAGDVFVFKGGVTWTGVYPWTLVGNGVSGSPDTYTTDHTWYAGSAWSQPVFDDGHAEPGATGMLNMSNGGYVKLNDLHFTNCGTSFVPSSSKCLVFTNSHDITLTNNTFTTYSWIGVYFVFSSAGSYSNFTVTGNDFSHVTGAVWFASAAGGAHEQNFIYTGNTFHDFYDMIGGGAHGDGALHYFNSPFADSTQYLDGLQFCDNYFYGNFTRGITGASASDMTGMIYLEGGVRNSLICNNVFTFSPVQNASGSTNIFEAIIDLRGYGNPNANNLRIYNNSIYGDPTKVSASAAILINAFTNGDLRNNIVVSGSYCGYGESGVPVGWTSDYNEWQCPNGFLTFIPSGPNTIPVNSPFSSNPQWAAAPGNLALTATSPAIAKGANLSSLGYSLLLTDKSGVARGTTWDMGAYEYSGQASGGPAPPTTLTITSVQ